MSDTTAIGLNVAKEMLTEEVMGALSGSIGANAFGAFMGQLATDTVFGRIWARPGLARRERSLVTLGILIALRGFSGCGDSERCRPHDAARAWLHWRRERRERGGAVAAQKCVLNQPDVVPGPRQRDVEFVRAFQCTQQILLA